jgi:hypothetical protein
MSFPLLVLVTPLITERVLEPQFATSEPAHAVNDINEIANYAGLLVPVLKSRSIAKDIKRLILQIKPRNLRMHKQVNYIINGRGQLDIIREKNLLKNVFGKDLEPETFLRLSNYFHNIINTPY